MNYIERMCPAQGLKVLVTAGASGVGAAIAAAFFETGAQIVICDVDEAALTRFITAHPGVRGVCADVSDAKAVDHLFDVIEDELGHLDVLVNNAGISGPTGPIETMDLADIRRTLDVDLMGQFIVIRRALPLLDQGNDASIINISSVAGRLGYAMRTPYAASKWGIVGLTASLAKEVGPEGIRVNAILPGVVRGPRMDGVIRARAEASGLTIAQMEEEYLSNISLRQMVGPEDIAGTALFLCSQAGQSISGQAISVCGNMETL